MCPSIHRSIYSSILFVVLALALVCPALHAQSGCTDSPEAPPWSSAWSAQQVCSLPACFAAKDKSVSNARMNKTRKQSLILQQPRQLPRGGYPWQFSETVRELEARHLISASARL